MRFEFTHTFIDGIFVAVPVGELDLTGAMTLRAELMEQLTTRSDPVVIRLDRVTLLDASGIGAIVAGYREACVRGVPYALAAPGPQAARTLQLTSIPGLISTYPGFSDALTSMRSHSNNVRREPKPD